MNLPLNRTAIATIATVLAVGIPCVAWYITASRAASQEAHRIREAPIVEARQEAERIAQVFGLRLEALRQSESRRSYMDYSVIDAAGTREPGCGPQPSPLAEGPTDPLVWTHFQIDEVGQLTLPTLVPQGRLHTARTESEIQKAILERLECAAPVDPDAPESKPGEARRETVGHDAWVVNVGPFRWKTVQLESNDVLVALRDVVTPSTTVRQGFVVRPTELLVLEDPAGLPVSIRPGEAEGDTEAAIPIEGEPWTVSVDASPKLTAAIQRAGETKSRFYKTFGIGFIAVLVGGALVITMVRHSERLAVQRARFAASAAHELRTPLAGLRMYGEMLVDGSGDPAQSKTYAKRIAGEAERLGRVVSNLLGFSRLERGQLALHCERGDLSTAVRLSVDQLRPALEASGAQLDVFIADDLPPVRFDRDAVHQILQNLLDNADKYARGANDRTIRVELDRAESGLTLSVSDHGPGVEPSIRHKLFEPFTRNNAADAPAGLGLGLALVRALALAQNARAAYSEVTSGGARFSVTFPGAA